MRRLLVGVDGEFAWSELRVLHVISWLAPRYGGPATLVPQACVALSRRGLDAEIATTNVDGDGVLDLPTGRAIDWQGALATFHPVSKPEWYGTSWSMARDLRQRLSSFDVVHIHGLYRFHGLVTAILAKSQGIPYVIQAHGSLDPWHRAHRRRAKDFYHACIEDRVIAGAAAMLCTSRREQSSIRRLGYSVPLQVIPIGVDAAGLRAPVTGDAELPMDGRERVVAFLGRISAKKGVPLLLEAFRSTAGAFPSTRLVIAGPDDEGIGRNLEALIAGVGPRGSDHVHRDPGRSREAITPAARRRPGLALGR